MDGRASIFYFGDDEAYLKALMGEFKKCTPTIIAFKRFFEKEENKIQSLFSKVLSDKPDCIIIDFSKNSQDYIHLARIIARSRFQHKLITVGVVDYLSPFEILREGMATGVDFVFIKSVESFDIAFHVSTLMGLNQGEHGFAVADLKESWEAGLPVKIGFVHPSGIHFETNYPLQKGDKLSMNHDFSRLKLAPSRNFFISEVSTENLFYNFKYSVDANFLFVDEFIPPEGMAPEEIELKKKEREEQVEYYKKSLLNWISKNKDYSVEKKVKVLIIDRTYQVYRDRPRSDKSDYTIRCIPYFLDMKQEVLHFSPQVIAFAMDKEGMAEPKNTNEQLVEMINFVKEKFPEEHPFVIVFNTKTTSREMKENFQYVQIMTTESELSAQLLARMAEAFNKKIEEDLKKTLQKVKKTKVFLSKTNATSLAEITMSVTVLKISETDLIFQTEKELPIGTNLHLTSPINTYINVQPSKGQGKTPEYRGLMHAMGEEDKRTLRKFVNSVFFRDHDAEIEVELEEFKKLNELKLEELQKLQKEEEEKAKEAKEEKGEEENKEVPSPENKQEVPPSKE